MAENGVGGKVGAVWDIYGPKAKINLTAVPTRSFELTMQMEYQM